VKWFRWQKCSCFVCLFTGLLLAPRYAQAHLIQTGFGGFYDGMAHLLMTPTDLLLVAGCGLLAGSQEKVISRKAILLFPIAWSSGILFGHLWPVAGELSVLTTISFGVVGGLVALNFSLPGSLCLGLIVLFGILHGLTNGATLATSGLLLSTVGISLGLVVIVTLIAAMTVSLHAGWQRVSVRVIGSWLAAVGMLMCGWMFRGLV